MGGMISQIIASEYPDRVNSLVLISTSSDDSYLSKVASSEWGTTEESIEKKLSNYFATSFYKKNKMLVRSMAKVMLKNQVGGFDEGAYLQRQAIDESDLSGIQKDITAPTLILHGKEDQIIGSEAASDLENRIANARAEVFEGIGHLLLAEMPVETYKNAIDFFLDNRNK